MSAAGGRSVRGLMHTLGLHRRELRSWALYDWANSAFVTTIGAAVLPIYYLEVAAGDLPGHTAGAYWAYTNSIALLLIAIASPVFGAMADYLGAKKRFLATFMGIGVLATASLFFVSRGDWLLASAIYVLGTVGLTASIAFADSLLPHIASGDEVDRVSTAGYALGYLGGGILLVLNLLMIMRPATFGLADAGIATRVVFLTVSVWWLLFSIPLFRDIAEPSRGLKTGEAPGQSPVRIGLRRVGVTIREVRHYRQLAAFLLAYWLYIDGIHTIQKLATTYGTEIGIGATDLIGGLIIAQFVGFPCTFAFGALSTRIGAKNGVYIGLGAYVVIVLSAFFVSEAWHFWALAAAVGVVQGGTQGLSRGIFASMIPKSKSAEFFSFFSVFEKFAGIFGPLIFGVVAQLTEQSRLGIVALVVFFVGGMLLLTRVDVEDGRRVAREEDLRSTVLPPAAEVIG